MKVGPLNFGLAIYPSQEVRDSAQSLTDSIQEKTPLTFRLDDTHLPHITLFQGGFPEGSKKKIIEVAEAWLNETSFHLFELALHTELYLHAVGNVFWNTDVPDALRMLHESSIQAFRPATEGCLMQQFVDRMLDPNTDLSDQQKKLVLKNGFSESGELFMPHMTLCRLNDTSQAEILSDITVPEMTFPVAEIIGGKLGNVGNIEDVWFSKKLHT